jgi:hypothetical protein
MKYSTSLLSSLLLTGCLADPAVSDEDEDAGTAAATRSDFFVLETKSFIAPITNIGSVGDPFRDALLAGLAVTTEWLLPENPQTGDRFENSTYRLWSHLEVRVTCADSRLIGLDLFNADTAVGFEGPLPGEIDPIQVTRVTGLPPAPAGFTLVASARPNIALEAGFFPIVGFRNERTIWHQIKAHAECDAFGNSNVVIDSVPNTNFPSVRVWLAKNPAFATTSARDLVHQEFQGALTELLTLENTPRPQF